MPEQRGLIITDPNFTATNLLPATIAAQLLADASLRHWFEARAGLCTFDTGAGNTDNIISFNDRKGTAQKLTRFSGTQHAVRQTNQINGYEAALFAQSASDRYTLGGETAPDYSQPFSWFLTFKFNDTAINKNIAGTFTSSSARAIVIYDAAADAVKFRFNGAFLTIPVSRTAWNALVVSYDGTRIRARAGGVEQAPVSISATPGTATFNLGALNGSQYWDGWIKHCLMFNGDVLADATNLARLTALASGYGLTL